MGLIYQAVWNMNAEHGFEDHTPDVELELPSTSASPL